jgi:trans-aconitate methyltransferase
MPAHERYRTFVKDQRDFFDALITEDWGTYFSPEWDETRRYEIACLFEKVQPASILDVGCGCGFHDREMASYSFVTEIDAFDYSLKSVEQAEKSYPHPKVTRWVGDFARDAPRRRYDLVVSFQVFEHLSEPVRYLEYCGTATTAGGAVAIFTPNRLRLRNWQRMRQGFEAELLDPQHYKEYLVSEIFELGRQTGLLPQTYFGYGIGSHSLVDRLSNRFRLRLGRAFYPLASGLCVILRSPPDRQRP